MIHIGLIWLGRLLQSYCIHIFGIVIIMTCWVAHGQTSSSFTNRNATALLTLRPFRGGDQLQCVLYLSKQEPIVDEKLQS